MPKFTTGGTTVELSDDLARWVDEWTRNLAPTTREVMDREIGRVHAEARASWPVKTGRSRDALEYVIVVESPDMIRATLINTAPYAKWIVSLKLPGNGSAFVELMRKPMKKVLDPIADALAADIRRAGG